MGRDRMKPYEAGKVTYRPHPTMPDMVQARALYRDRYDKRREVSGSGKTNAAARRDLEGNLRKKRDTHEGGNIEVNHRSTVSDVARAWLDNKERARSAPETLRSYKSTVQNHIHDRKVSTLTIGAFNDVGVLRAWLKDIADCSGNGAAGQAYKVAKGVLTLAEESNAIPASVMHRVKRSDAKAKAGTVGDNRCEDEECDYECGKRHLNTERAFTSDEAARVLAASDASTADIGDLCHFLYSTGVRISEAVLHVEWRDVQFDTDAEGRGKVRVRGTKTKRSDRTLPLSPQMCERLKARAERYGTEGLVFGQTRIKANLGKPRDVRNVRARIRTVLKAEGCEWAATHTFRRTVASQMDKDPRAGIAEIANQLGHANVATTMRYLGREEAPTLSADIMAFPEATMEPEEAKPRRRLKAV